jgi:hypothetical protein
LAENLRQNGIDKIFFHAYIKYMNKVKAMNGKVAQSIVSEMECHQLKVFLTKI